MKRPLRGSPNSNRVSLRLFSPHSCDSIVFPPPSPPDPAETTNSPNRSNPATQPSCPTQPPYPATLPCHPAPSPNPATHHRPHATHYPLHARPNRYPLLTANYPLHATCNPAPTNHPRPSPLSVGISSIGSLPGNRKDGRMWRPTRVPPFSYLCEQEGSGSGNLFWFFDKE